MQLADVQARDMVSLLVGLPQVEQHVQERGVFAEDDARMIARQIAEVSCLGGCDPAPCAHRDAEPRSPP